MNKQPGQVMTADHARWGNLELHARHWIFLPVQQQVEGPNFADQIIVKPISENPRNCFETQQFDQSGYSDQDER